MKIFNFTKRVIMMPVLLCIIACVGLAFFCLFMWLLGLGLHSVGVPYTPTSSGIPDRTLSLGLAAALIAVVACYAVYGVVVFCRWIKQQWRES